LLLRIQRDYLRAIIAVVHAHVEGQERLHAIRRRYAEGQRVDAGCGEGVHAEQGLVLVAVVRHELEGIADKGSGQRRRPLCRDMQREGLALHGGRGRESERDERAGQIVRAAVAARHPYPQTGE